MSSTPSHPPAISEQLQLELDLLAAEADRPAAPATDCADAAGRGGFTILVAGDDPDMRAYLRLCLYQEYEPPVRRVLEAPDGQTALALARQGGIDLIISDVDMPRLDGLALCRALQANAALSRLPVLLITGKAEPENLPVTAHGVLLKPFNASKLHAWLVRLLPGASGRSPPQARPP